MASSLAAGMVIQYTTTFLTSLVLAFVWSWSLTLVILSAVPVLMIIQTLSQVFVGPRLASERVHTASAATLVDRAVAAIATVKAFNAEKHEQGLLSDMLHKIGHSAIKCHTVWSLSTCASQFTMMAMFVQAFWFGAKLVRDAFELAKEKAPAIIFIDELDAIGTKRFDSEKSGDREVQRTMLELLNQLDGFSSDERIKVRTFSWYSI